MTTIVITDTEIAWDSQLTTDTQRLGQCDKVWTYDGKIYCGAGTYAAVHEVINRLRGGYDLHDETLSKEDWEVVVIDKPGSVMLYADRCPYPIPHPVPMTMGSGAHYARGALAAGKSALEALLIASQFDIHTGGPFRCEQIADFLKKSKVPDKCRRKRKT